MPKTIDEFKDAYFFLSNFYAAPHIVNDILFPTTEHSFHAHKSKKKADWITISRLATPMQAKKMGGKNGSIKIRDDWEDGVRDRVMLKVVRLKFEIPALRIKLLETGNATLVEGNWWGDDYWGVVKGKGKNKLGKILMRVRDELNE